MSHTKNGWGHYWKNGSHLEKCVTFGKIDHACKNRSLLETWVTLEK